MVTVSGLAAKSAILIVEFAVEQRAAGKTLREAAIEAAHLRFRPILMTSFAFILGVLLIPLFFVVVRRVLGDKLDEPSPQYIEQHKVRSVQQDR